MARLDAFLDGQHRDALDRAVRNILGTGLALKTCAQIADGLPLASVAYDQYRRTRPAAHPIAEHTSLCPGAEGTARYFLERFGIGMVDFDDKLLQAYQSAPPGHRSFDCRLIELVAVAVHQMAVILFLRGHRIHDRQPRNAASTINRVTSWLLEDEDPEIKEKSKPRRPATLFAHRSYDARKQYPNGVADVVGYWAENRILGGVIVFDRSSAWGRNEPRPEPNVWIHSDRDGVTLRLCQLLDEQQQALVGFLRSLSVGACPCPLSASDRNRERLDPEDGTDWKVYRDVWERAPNLNTRRGAHGVGGCHPLALDYPEWFIFDDWR